MTSPFPDHLKRPLIPNGCRRAPWHDYYDRCIYLITINAAPGIPPFSHLTGIPGDHAYPPTPINTSLGELIASSLSGIKKDYPFTQILRRVIMPEHIHFILFITQKTQYHLGDIITSFKSACTRNFANRTEKRTSDFSVSLTSVFEEGYHDRILTKKDQLERMKHYVSDNPRRRLLRMLHPEFHSRYFATADDGRQFEVYGNPFLLNDHDIEPVRISRSFSPDLLKQRKITWKKTVENGGVLISPFISEAERKVRDWAIDNGGRLILIEENGFGPRYAPKGRLHDLCSEGRLLLIAPSHTP